MRRHKGKEPRNFARCRYCSHEKTKNHSVRCPNCGWWKCGSRKLARKLKREEKI